MSGAWDFESTANKLVAYFERQDQERPEDYVDGANAARALARVMSGDDADAAGSLPRQPVNARTRSRAPGD